MRRRGRTRRRSAGRRVEPSRRRFLSRPIWLLRDGSGGENSGDAAHGVSNEAGRSVSFCRVDFLAPVYCTRRSTRNLGVKISNELESGEAGVRGSGAVGLWPVGLVPIGVGLATLVAFRAVLIAPFGFFEPTEFEYWFFIPGRARRVLPHPRLRSPGRCQPASLKRALFGLSSGRPHSALVQNGLSLIQAECSPDGGLRTLSSCGDSIVTDWMELLFHEPLAARSRRIRVSHRSPATAPGNRCRTDTSTRPPRN
jgi:hypothetical protein